MIHVILNFRYNNKKRNKKSEIKPIEDQAKTIQKNVQQLKN